MSPQPSLEFVETFLAARKNMKKRKKKKKKREFNKISK